MNNGIHFSELATAAETAIQAAWGALGTGGVIAIEIGDPTLSIAAPYAVIDFGDEVDIDFDTAGQDEQSYTLTIFGRFLWPTDTTKKIRLEQAARATELIAQMQTGATFATSFYLPLVNKVRMPKEADPLSGEYSVELDFTCRAAVDHH